MTHPAPSREVLEARVAEGIKFLDNRYPGWSSPGKIDPDQIVMIHGGRCVLSRVTGSDHWESAKHSAGLGNKQCADLGFAMHSVEAQSEGYEILDDIWKSVIRKRQSSPSPSNTVSTALQKATHGNPTHTVLLTDDEINKAAAASVNIHTLTVNGETVRGSWQTILNVLNNLDPSNLEVTIS